LSGGTRLGVAREEKKMSNEPQPTHGVMEGAGSYNLHAKVPAGGATLALPFLEQAASAIAIEGGNQPVVIVDYGSSQGKNSLAPMRAAAKALRTRVGAARPIIVVHVDQAANDFNTLFDVLHCDPERYSADDPNVFPSAVGRSFYESVLPGEHVHLAWSSYAAVWLSRIPMPIPDHFVSLAGTGEAREAFERQAADDWKLFLSLRAGELRPGARLVVVLPGANDDGSVGFEPLFKKAKEALAELSAEGVITPDQREQMVLGCYPRRKRELLAPFTANGLFAGLSVEHCDLSGLPDAAWVDYERDANREILATRHAAFFRAIFVPSLASALIDSGKRQQFADAVEQKLRRMVADEPAPIHSYVQTIVLAKRDAVS
jgi:SAM dependent carboxyl methyltransferase